MHNNLRNELAHNLKNEILHINSENEIVHNGIKFISKNFEDEDIESLKEYLEAEGFGSLNLMKSMSKENIIEVIDKAGLRERNSSAHNIAKKFRSLINEKNIEKAVVCSIDDKSLRDLTLLEKDSFRVLEGMIIAGNIIEASEGYIYLGKTYPDLNRKVEKYINELFREGLLGEQFKIKVVYEKLNEKTLKTKENHAICINNIETLAVLPTLFSADLYTYLENGTKESRGTKLINILGDVNEPGVYEIPFGVTLREIVYEVGKGIFEDKRFKFMMLCEEEDSIITENLLNIKYTYEDLSKYGLKVCSEIVVMSDN
ncbi:hypothetical protein [Clostridium intestinale]|uniref:hypothetical protein n=1 Tax=Clostridium intestinale TaxID=36845 RepID=UPI0028E1A802|nr:hypothetical protein [Clostridium intestinale]